MTHSIWILSGGGCVRSGFAADFEACVELYRLNEPGRFPPGILPEFERALQQGGALYLVIDEGGLVVGCGGVHIKRTAQVEIGFLSFGLVHPLRHRHGLGTTLLLARLAILPRNISLVGLMPVPASQPFYARFGFFERGRVKLKSGYEGPVCCAQVTPDDLEQCLTLLSRADARLPAEECVVPVREDEEE